MSIMGTSLAKFLNDYFSVEDLKDALSEIGELTTGTKIELIKRLMSQWEPHRRNRYDLLDHLDEEMLSYFCQDYKIDHKGNASTLKRRIKKEGLLGIGSKVNNSNQSSVTKEGLTDSKEIKKSPVKSFFSVRNIMIILSIGVAVTTILYNLTNIIEIFSKH